MLGESEAVTKGVEFARGGWGRGPGGGAGEGGYSNLGIFCNLK